MLRNKRSKNTQSISSEDVANLTIFKNAIKESNTLRNIEMKKKIISLKQSTLFLGDEEEKSEQSE